MAKGLCSRCEKPLDGAHKSYCKACAAEYARAQRAKVPGANAAYQREWHKKNPDKQPRYKRKSHLKVMYGLTELEVQAMRTFQKNQCAICHTELTDELGARRLHIDHDHNSGQVRELLCSNCNMMIGLANEDQWVLSQAITYIRRHRIRKVQ